MKLTETTEINRSQTEIAALLANPALSKQWMEDLDTYEPLSGEPGMSGSTARLTFKNGKRRMAFVSTVVSTDLPRELRTTLDSPFVCIEAVATLEAISANKTRYTFIQHFSFKGFPNKLLGFLARGSIKRQQRRHMEGFKRFADRQS